MKRKPRTVDPDVVIVTHNAAKNDRGTVKHPMHDRARAGDDARFWRTPLSKHGNKKYNPKEPPQRVDAMVVPWALKLRATWRPMANLDRMHDVLFENRVREDRGMFRPVLEGLDLQQYTESILFFSRSIVETFQARMVKRRPAPQFKIDDCEWSLKQQAMDAQTNLDAKLGEAKFGALYGMMIRDAEVRGDGVTVVDEGDDDVFMERAQRREFLIDPYEARHGAGAVRTLYRVRAVSRDSLIARFPQHRKAILDAPDSVTALDEISTSDMNVDTSLLGQRDLVDFVEAWHLRSDDACDDDDLDAMDGRHAGCLDGVTLWYRPWYSARFPIARLTRHQPQEGFWGYGDMEILRRTQSIIDQMVSDIEQNIAVTGKGVWITPPGISPDQLVGYAPFHLTSAAGAGGKMEFYHPQPVGQGAVDLLERMIAKMHDLTGAAQWSVQGKSPVGAGASGVAIDTMEDLLSDRHAVFEEACAQYVVDVAQLYVDAAQRIARRLKDAAPRKKKPDAWLDQYGIHKVAWDEIGKFRLICEPVGSMPRSRAGKLAWVSEMLARGFLPGSAALGLMEDADTKHHTRIFLAALRNCERMMQELGNAELPMSQPEEFHDLPLLLLYAKAYYNLAQASKPPAPEEVQDRYRIFIDAVTEVQAQVAEKEAAQQAKLAAIAGQNAPGAPAPAGGGEAKWHGVPLSKIPELAARRAARQAQAPTTADVLASRGLTTQAPAAPDAAVASPAPPIAGM